MATERQLDHHQMLETTSSEDGDTVPTWCYYVLQEVAQDKPIQLLSTQYCACFCVVCYPCHRYRFTPPCASMFLLTSLWRREIASCRRIPWYCVRCRPATPQNKSNALAGPGFLVGGGCLCRLQCSRVARPCDSYHSFEIARGLYQHQSKC